jgi:hypothetical protein
MMQNRSNPCLQRFKLSASLFAYIRANMLSRSLQEVGAKTKTALTQSAPIVGSTRPRPEIDGRFSQTTTSVNLTFSLVRIGFRVRPTQIGCE